MHNYRLEFLKRVFSAYIQGDCNLMVDEEEDVHNLIDRQSNSGARQSNMVREEIKSILANLEKLPPK
jgi:hypothetical protein